MPPAVVDTREQLAYEFAGSVIKTLVTGDYSLAGQEDRVTVERKSKADAYNSLGRRRARFRREFQRLGHFDYAAIVIESSVPDFLQQPPYSRLNPRVAISTLLAWYVRYRVPVFFAGDREHGRALTHKLLKVFWQCRNEVRDGLAQA